MFFEEPIFSFRPIFIIHLKNRSYILNRLNQSDVELVSFVLTYFLAFIVWTDLQVIDNFQKKSYHLDRSSHSINLIRVVVFQSIFDTSVRERNHGIWLFFHFIRQSLQSRHLSNTLQTTTFGLENVLYKDKGQSLLGPTSLTQIG